MALEIGGLQKIKNKSGLKNAIAVDSLNKRFDDVQAVIDLSFEVRRGELFGFLGPNGAGKTTTINMLTGLARPDSGNVNIGGIECSRNPRAAQHLVGVVPDESNLYPELTGLENLCFCAALYGINKVERQRRARELLDKFNLTQARNRKFAEYSKGMKRKLTIAAGIIHEPEILFLDEPTTGIDVTAARQLRQLIEDLHEKGTTIFLTTHYIEEAERLCDRIAFIVSGRIIDVDSVENLIQPIQNKHVMQISCSKMPDGVLEKLSASFSNMDFKVRGLNTIRIESDKPAPAGTLVRFLEDQGAEVIEAKRIRLSLEDVFVQITGIESNIMEKGGSGK